MYGAGGLQTGIIMGWPEVTLESHDVNCDWKRTGVNSLIQQVISSLTGKTLGEYARSTTDGPQVA